MIDERQLTVLKAQYQEVGTNFRTVWDFYLKFYIAFMALNFTALGLVVQYMGKDSRWPVIASFAVQNLLSAGTAVGLAAYSKFAAQQQQAITNSSLGAISTNLEYQSPIPSKLAVWGAYANAASHFLFIVCWVAALYVDPIKGR